MATFETVQSIIANQLCINPVNVKRDSVLQTDLKMDSLDMVETVIAIEEEFRIEIADPDVEKWEIVQNIVDDIEKK